MPAYCEPPAQPKPPMFRFTIRDVLWLTVMVALGLTLWREHQARAEVVNDARILADYSANGVHDGNALLRQLTLEAKYGAREFGFPHRLSFVDLEMESERPCSDSRSATCYW